MIEVQAVIQNEHGIHCRPTAVIMKAIGAYEGTIEVTAPEGRTDPRSMLGLMSLCLVKGTQVTIRVEGPDEQSMSEKLKILFETKFDFPR